MPNNEPQLADSDESLADHLETLLNSPTPNTSAHAFAIQLRDGGMSQDRLYHIFDIAHNRHVKDTDETRYDVVVDVLCNIVGYCSPHAKLYPHTGIFHPKKV